jgi:hypothetical protein
MQYIVVSVLLALVLLYLLRHRLQAPEATSANHPLLTVSVQSEPKSTTMVKVSINNLRALHKRNPTAAGSTYEIPIAKYTPLQTVTIETTGTVTVTKIDAAGTDLLPLMQYYGTESMTAGQGTPVTDGKFATPGVYGYIYETNS